MKALKSASESGCTLACARALPATPLLLLLLPVMLFLLLLVVPVALPCCLLLLPATAAVDVVDVVVVVVVVDALGSRAPGRWELTKSNEAVPLVGMAACQSAGGPWPSGCFTGPLHVSCSRLSHVGAPSGPAIMLASSRRRAAMAL